MTPEQIRAVVARGFERGWLSIGPVPLAKPPVSHARGWSVQKERQKLMEALANVAPEDHETRRAILEKIIAAQDGEKPKKA
jgi:hypothetical protein